MAEFKKMSKKVMAQLMLDGHTLEFENGDVSYFYEETTKVYNYNVPFIRRLPTEQIRHMGCRWNSPCRIYKPKVKRWKWKLDGGDGIILMTVNHYSEEELFKKNNRILYPILEKIKETEIEEEE